MRPRISRTEAKYIVELLTASAEILKQNEAYFQELDKKVFELKNKQMWDTYSVFMEGLPEKRTELEKWKHGLAHSVFYHKQMHEILLEKYTNIASGNKHRGAYKHSNCRISWHSRNREEGTLKPILERQLQPIAELGKRKPLSNGDCTNAEALEAVADMPTHPTKDYL